MLAGNAMGQIAAVSSGTLIQNDAQILNVFDRISSPAVGDGRRDSLALRRDLPKIPFVNADQFCGFRRRKVTDGLLCGWREAVSLMRLELFRQISCVALNQRPQLGHRRDQI